jgi:ADP-ribose pyrophosphatase YjhB (NUDIX family)
MIPRERYSEIIKDTHLIACDLLIKRGDTILLGKRMNAPARNYLFNPGSRMFKNEKYQETIQRILFTECGIQDIRGDFIYHGTFEHRYHKENFTEPQKSELQQASFGTVYYTHAFIWDLEQFKDEEYLQYIMTTLERNRDEQHEGQFMWIPLSEIRKENGCFQGTKIHPFVRFFFVSQPNKLKSFRLP